ncbi:MAG: hypothetical protein WCO00_17045 [Rhodospirillaceae bacterium]
MTVAAIMEMGAVLAPCAAGLIQACRSMWAAAGRGEAIDLGALADTLSLWSLIAVGGFCAVRLFLRATRGDGTSTEAQQENRSHHDRRLSRLLTVLVGFAALLVCEPLGDVAERWFIRLAHAVVQSAAMNTPIGYAGLAVQILVASAALAIVVRIWDSAGSRFLGLTVLSPARFRR